MSGRKYKECIAKERAGGESLFDLTSDFNKLLGGDNNQVVYQNNINPQLWQASLEVTKKYPLKIADNQGGFIETDWIYDVNNTQQRCLIKIQVLSRDLITTGVAFLILSVKKTLMEIGLPIIRNTLKRQNR